MPEPLRAVSYLPPERAGEVSGRVVLRHDERRVRRKLLRLTHGDEVLVDFPQPVTLQHRGALVLADGRQIQVIAAEEPLYEVRGGDTMHLMQLAWHLGNRHLPVQIERHGTTPRLLILRDHVIRDMLLGLDATVTEVSDAFAPMEGAYSGHGAHTHALLNR